VSRNIMAVHVTFWCAGAAQRLRQAHSLKT
jgi:hypothetical protein